ncbi:unnamed protein product [Urochloa humidicola]
MSASALKDLNISQPEDLEKGKDISTKSCISKPVLNGSKCASKEENAASACPDAVTNGNEAVIADVEYIDSENLVDLPDVDATLSTLVKRLDSKDWIMTCEALNNVRQLCAALTPYAAARLVREAKAKGSSGAPGTCRRQ